MLIVYWKYKIFFDVVYFYSVWLYLVYGVKSLIMYEEIMGNVEVCFKFNECFYFVKFYL